MKNNKMILLGAAVAAFTLTSFANEVLSSPRQISNQMPMVSSSASAPTISVAYVDNGSARLSPRAQANQTKGLQGTNYDVNPALVCRNAMSGSSPKAIDACTSNPNMPACKPMTVAPLK